MTYTYYLDDRKGTARRFQLTSIVRELIARRVFLPTDRGLEELGWWTKDRILRIVGELGEGAHPYVYADGEAYTMTILRTEESHP